MAVTTSFGHLVRRKQQVDLQKPEPTKDAERHRHLTFPLKKDASMPLESTPKCFTPGWGRRLTYARKRAGLTQAELGESLGLRNTAVSKWEKESTEGIDARGLTAMEHLHGIQSAWILSGQEPAVIPKTEQVDFQGHLDQLASARIIGAWMLPVNAGMAPVFHPGEVVFWAKVEDLLQGEFLVASPKGGSAQALGLDPDGYLIGQAIQSKANDEWLMYRLQDKDQPGAFPAVRLNEMNVIGRIVAKASIVHS